MAQSTLATSADYADAMMSLRRAKNWAFLLLLLCLLGQLTIFFLVHYGVVKPYAGEQSAAPAGAAASTALLRYLVGLTDFAGIVLVAILALDLLLITQIMVVGRLIGVGRLSSALIWSVVLGVLIFPWQAFLNWQWLSGYRLPGILFTWYELMDKRLWTPQEGVYAVLLWGRFVIWPLVAIILLLVIQARSTRGLRMALGESDGEVELQPEVAT
jgi:hypothetical protein